MSLKIEQLKLLIFGLFILVHICLLNVNQAEWGDSYRILRASEYIQDLTYPADEKRPPLFSALLALRPVFADPILWGRGVMFLLSCAVFWLFYKLTQKFLVDIKSQVLALVFFAFNPVLLYWSLRIYADFLLLFFVLLAFYILYLSTFKFKWVLLGLVCGLSILTRFEGYVLFGAIGISFLPQGLKKKSEFIKGLQVLSGFLLVQIPFFLYRNPFASSYISETSQMPYNLSTLSIFIVSLLFALGTTLGPIWILRSWDYIKKFAKQYQAIMYFCVLELILIALWPAAIPRLFVQVIPFLIIFACYGALKPVNSRLALVFGLITLVFVVSQYFLKLQFLMVVKPVFVFVILVQILATVLLLYKQEVFGFLIIAVGMLVWTLSTIIIHAPIYSSISNMSKYVANNVQGNIIYNDVSSVANWHLSFGPKKDLIKSKYININGQKDLEKEKSEILLADYLIITNEHNQTLSIKTSQLSYLELIKEFSYNIDDKIFYSMLFKVNRN